MGPRSTRRLLADERDQTVRDACPACPGDGSGCSSCSWPIRRPPTPRSPIELELPVGSIGPTRGRCLARLRVLLAGFLTVQGTNQRHRIMIAAKRSCRGEEPGPDHCPEPSGTLRPAGVAGMPGAHLAGYRVAVVCPRAAATRPIEVIDSVELHKYRPYAPGGSKFSFVAEYAYSFLATAWTTLKARRSGRFAVIQACNPPDIFWPLAMAFRAVEGTRFVFDHHDLCPELYQSRFRRRRSCRTGGCWPWSAGHTGRRTMSSPPMTPTGKSR